METLKKLNQINSDYNQQPVFYCKNCLSLKIRGVEEYNYCDECGSTDIEETSIFNWEEMYKNKFGVSYLNN